MTILRGDRFHGRVRLLFLLAALAWGIPAGVAAQVTNPVKLVRGIITDTRTKTPVDGGMVFAYTGTATEPAARSRINPKTGAYQMILDPGTKYRLHVESPSYYGTDIAYTSPSGSAYEEVDANFTVQGVPTGLAIYSGRLFGNGSARLAPTSEFNKAVGILASNRYMNITVTVAVETGKPPKKKGGTTAGSQESDNSGQALTSQRTGALREYLAARGIDEERITWKTAPKITASMSKKKASGADVSIELDRTAHDSNR